MSAKTVADVNVAGGLVLDIGRREKRLQLRDAEGNLQAYVLREPGDAAKKRYSMGRIKALRGMDIDVKDGRPSLPSGKLSVEALEGLQGNEVQLISLCLFRVEEGGEVPVSAEQVGEWPSSTVTVLFSEAEQIAGLKSDNADELRKQRAVLDEAISRIEGGQDDPKG